MKRYINFDPNLLARRRRALMTSDDLVARKVVLHVFEIFQSIFSIWELILNLKWIWYGHEWKKITLFSCQYYSKLWATYTRTMLTQKTDTDRQNILFKLIVKLSNALKNLFLISEFIFSYHQVLVKCLYPQLHVFATDLIWSDSRTSSSGPDECRMFAFWCKTAWHCSSSKDKMSCARIKA